MFNKTIKLFSKIFGISKNIPRTEQIEAIFDYKIFKFPGTSVWMRIADLLTGVQVWGGTGSGKTSGPGRFLAKNLLKMPFGFLVMCAKTSETKLWQRLCGEADRENDMIIFGENTPFNFNFLEYEMHRNGRYSGDTNEIVDLLMKVYEVGKNFSAGSSAGGDERFWDNGMRRLLAKSINLLRLSGQEISFINIRRIIVDMFLREDVEKYRAMLYALGDESLPEEQRIDAYRAYEYWKQENYFLACFSAAISREDLSAEEVSLFDTVEEYFLKIAPRLADDTRSTFVESVLGLIEPFSSNGILKKHFTQGISSEVMPRNIFENGKILVLDFPIKKYGVSAVYAQAIMKLMWQTEMERRDLETEDNPMPCVLWCDEAQLFLNPEYDSAFQSTSRSSGAICVYLSQNLNGYYNAMGGNNTKARTLSLLGNIGMSVFCANSDYDTNEYAAKMIGRVFREMSGYSTDKDGKISSSIRSEYHYQIPPEMFTALRNGRKHNRFSVETIIFKSSVLWDSGENKVNFGRVEFNQKY